MSSPELPEATTSEIKEMVEVYLPERAAYAKLAKRVENDLVEHNVLRSLIHSTKQREKDPTHLFDKLKRKALEALTNGKAFGITKDNLFTKLGDLAGVRLLHIYNDQLTQIHPTILAILKFHKYTLREKPLVYIWDVERKVYLKKLGLKVVERPNMYTSVHYVVQPFWAKNMACEIQVRTLAEELWGEVSHKVNYPHETDSIACKEQLASLARIASGCTRLVDSIFASETEHKARATEKTKAESSAAFTLISDATKSVDSNPV